MKSTSHRYRPTKPFCRPGPRRGRFQVMMPGALSAFECQERCFDDARYTRKIHFTRIHRVRAVRSAAPRRAPGGAWRKPRRSRAGRARFRPRRARRVPVRSIVKTAFLALEGRRRARHHHLYSMSSRPWPTKPFCRPIPRRHRVRVTCATSRFAFWAFSAPPHTRRPRHQTHIAPEICIGARCARS